MGGALTLASAAKLDGLSAAVANYGIPPTTPGAFPEVSKGCGRCGASPHLLLSSTAGPRHF